MSRQNQESHNAEDRAPELELNKETLQDLDLEPADANEVKGGNVSTLGGTSRTVFPNQIPGGPVSTSRP